MCRWGWLMVGWKVCCMYSVYSTLAVGIESIPWDRETGDLKSHGDRNAVEKWVVGTVPLSIPEVKSPEAPGGLKRKWCCAT